MNVIQADVFDILKEYEQNGRLFDMIILIRLLLQKRKSAR